MVTIRFGLACDGPPGGGPCGRAYPDYNSGSDIGSCSDCMLELCEPCSRETGHARREDEGRIILRCPDVEESA
jgi:hypothetical protein